MNSSNKWWMNLKERITYTFSNAITNLITSLPPSSVLLKIQKSTVEKNSLVLYNTFHYANFTNKISSH